MPKNTFYNLDDEKKERVIDTAIKEFAEKGYLNSSIQSIANNASISKGSMYQYFENKKELFEYITELAIKIKTNYMTKLMKENKSLSYFDLIEKMLTISFYYYKEYPDLYKIYQNMQSELQEDTSNEINKKIQKLGDKYNKNLLIKALENKEVRDDLDVELISFIVYGLLKCFGTFLLNNESLMSDKEQGEYVYQFIEFLKIGLNPTLSQGR